MSEHAGDRGVSERIERQPATRSRTDEDEYAETEPAELRPPATE